MMKTSIFLFLLTIPLICFGQKIVRINEGTIRLGGDSIAYFDARQNQITKKAFADSVSTQKYIIQFGGSDEYPEVHLVYKYPPLENLIGKSLPQFAFQDIDGKSVRMNESGITVLCFWNNSCAPCIRELTVLDILAKDYPNVRFLAFTPNTAEEVYDLIERLNLKWENITLIPGYNNEFVDTLKIFVFPSNVVINNNMEIIGVTLGGNTRTLLRTLEALSGETITEKNEIIRGQRR